MIRHRGPDGRGWRVEESAFGPVALGHRRLKIVDLSDGGQQPMVDPTGRYLLVFNGEIYNYIELRQELMAKGEIFLTSSDSEVLLRAFSCWGEACLPRLRGMFAFIVWDRKTSQLFAARDHYGIKPLYFCVTNKSICLASEIKQLLGLPGVTGRMNIPRVHDFLASGMSDHTSQTMFEGVLQLRGGELLCVDTAGQNLNPKIHRWHEQSESLLNLDLATASAQFGRLLEESVQLHLRSDVPVGSCLSGGLDSSSIVALMNKMRDKQNNSAIHTVSACYDDRSVDEKPFMDAVVKETGVTPHFIFPRAEDVFEQAEAITWHQDEPFGSTSIAAQWTVFKAAKDVGIKVMLDGQGADEQLAGYHFAFPYYQSQLLRSGNWAAFIQLTQERRRVHGAGYSAQLPRLFSVLMPGSIAEGMRRAHRRIFGNDWLGSDLLSTQGNNQSAMQTALDGIDQNRPQDLDAISRVMVRASNLPMLLHWEDRNSMAHSIEARVPFLDNPLVAFSLGLGNNHKIVGSETKTILRRAMQGITPEAVLARQDKLGFATPEQNWFRGPLKTLVHEGIENSLKRYPDVFNAAGVRAMRDAMLDGKRPVDHSLWRIISLGIWGKCFEATT